MAPARSSASPPAGKSAADETAARAGLVPAAAAPAIESDPAALASDLVALASDLVALADTAGEPGAAPSPGDELCPRPPGRPDESPALVLPPVTG
ncbi:MAG TPA: hypothetical protein VK698_25090 [Kofleriaceae bacterium]|nr:hypothetical protein [Kofleriaceae bacterium]